jgi:hypothetical protein
MPSPYLDRPLLPLAVALPRMLAEIETALLNAGQAEKRRLSQRAELIRGLLTPNPSAGDDETATRGAGATLTRPLEPDPAWPA